MPENYHLEEDGDVVEKDNLHNPFDNLSKNQKISLSVLGFFAFFVLIFGVAQFKNSISSPFDIPDKDTDVADQCLDGNCSSLNNQASLSNKDTDKDGISDWEELNVYLTSPYLVDSDSDGISDKDEIINNNDPSCPVGMDCGSITDIENYDGEAKINQGLIDSGTEKELSESEKLYLDVVSGDSEPDKIRTLLVGGGMTKEQVDSLNDDQIMEIYKKALESASQPLK